MWVSILGELCSSLWEGVVSTQCDCYAVFHRKSLELRPGGQVEKRERRQDSAILEPASQIPKPTQKRGEQASRLIGEMVELSESVSRVSWSRKSRMVRHLGWKRSPWEHCGH